MSEWWTAITEERLARWGKLLEWEQATPLVLVGIGHEEKSGLIVVLTTEGTGKGLIVAWLRHALRELEAEGDGGNRGCCRAQGQKERAHLVVVGPVV